MWKICHLKPIDLKSTFDCSSNPINVFCHEETIVYDPKSKKLLSEIEKEIHRYYEMREEPTTLIIGVEGYKLLVGNNSHALGLGQLELSNLVFGLKVIPAGQGEGFLVTTGDIRKELSISFFNKKLLNK